MGAVFVVGGLDVHVQPSGESRFFLSGVNRVTGRSTQLGVARWEPGELDFGLHLNGQQAFFPDGSPLLDDLLTRLDAVRTWYQDHEQPDPRLGILIGDNTTSH